MIITLKFFWIMQEFLAGHKEPQARGSYGSGLDTGYRSSYSQYSSSSYPPSHSPYYGPQGSPRSGGGYGSYRY